MYEATNIVAKRLLRYYDYRSVYVQLEGFLKHPVAATSDTCYFRTVAAWLRAGAQRPETQEVNDAGQATADRPRY